MHRRLGCTSVLVAAAILAGVAGIVARPSDSALPVPRGLAILRTVSCENVQAFYWETRDQHRTRAEALAAVARFASAGWAGLTEIDARAAATVTTQDVEARLRECA